MRTAAIFWGLMVVGVAREVAAGEPDGPVTYTRDLTMPGVSPKEPEAYLCTAFPLNASVEEWVIKFEPLASANRAHHMLLYGCTGVRHTTEFWDCGHHGVCEGGQIMYAWAQNAPATSLPEGVGFRMGGASRVQYLTLQIHYAVALPDVVDHSGLRMELTTTPQQYKAGILLMVDGSTFIPAFAPKIHADVSCRAKDASVREDIHVFGYRVHTHSLGMVVSGYKYDEKTGEFSMIAKGNPKWPQAFYPMEKVMTISPEDIIAARCTYNATLRSRSTRIGSTKDDEMCNLYLMYYTDTEKGEESATCFGQQFRDVIANLPAGSDVPLPPNPLLEEKAHGENTNKEVHMTYKPVLGGSDELTPALPQPAPTFVPITVEKKAHQYEPLPPQEDEFKLHPKLVDPNKQAKLLTASTPPATPATILPTIDYQVREGWPLPGSFPRVGQVAAVDVDGDNVIIFHRGSRVWDMNTFTAGNRLANSSAVGPIKEHTLLLLDAATGQLLQKWGDNFFYLPHGLTVDGERNMWLTDVAMHQVMKFPPHFGDGKPLLTLGTRLEPGSDSTHFCKPTSVAVLQSGQFYVADGYCNNRIIKFNSDGSIITQISRTPAQGIAAFGKAPEGEFAVPHGLALAEDKGEVCVADREHGRVQCFDTSDAPAFRRLYQLPEWGTRLFDVAYSPINGGRLLCANGPQIYGNHKVEVYQLDFATGQLLSRISPKGQGFTMVHDVAVTADGAELYVTEIGPNVIWKFESEALLKARPHTKPLKTAIKDEAALHAKQILDGIGSGITKLGSSLDSDNTKWSSVGVSTVVLGLLAVPIVVLTTVTLIVRAKKRGSIHMRSSRNGSTGGFGLSNGTTGSNWRTEGNGLHQLGSSLLNKHRGFRQLATEDIDEPSSGDSDIEEFSQVAAKA